MPVDGNAAAPSGYSAWNSRVAFYWLTASCGQNGTYLTVTPRSLAASAAECDGIALEEAQAEDDFVQAVRVHYSDFVLGRQDGLLSFKNIGPDGFPMCLGFLAFSVLAAFRMRADDNNRATAYWVRLAQMLNVPLVREWPADLSPQVFEALWQFAREWTVEKRLPPLYLPTAAVLRRYVAYPLAHVGLRQVDVEKIPEFFAWAQYPPGAAVGESRLREDFRTWARDRAPLTIQGRTAVDDDRLDAIVQQVAAELRRWDGVSRDEQGRRAATVELVLDVVRGLPQLAYLARRPEGFPETFLSGDRSFDSSEEGWYDPVPVLPQDGNDLRTGFAWEQGSQSAAVLRRAGADSIAFARSESYTGSLSRRRLLAGVPCAILYHNTVADKFERGFESLGCRTARRFSEGCATLPEGWRLITDILVQPGSAPSETDIDALQVDSVTDILTVGGLRIGRTATWLAGAAPTLYVSGDTNSVSIDGRAVRVQADGSIDLPQPSQPGIRLVQAGCSRRRLGLVKAELSPELVRIAASPIAPGHVTPLPTGHWTLIGADPGQSAFMQVESGDLPSLDFCPSFALRSGRKASLLYLAPPEQLPGAPCGPDPIKAWATLILDCHARAIPLAVWTSHGSKAAEKAWRRLVSRASKEAEKLRGAKAQ